jgi:MFS family permease
MMSLGLLCFSWITDNRAWLIVPFFVLFGVGYGGVNTSRVSLVREYFGRSNFGTIFGLLTGVSTIGSILGPYLAGWVYDSWSSYQVIWFIFAAFPIIVAIFVFNISPVNTTGTSPRN